MNDHEYDELADATMRAIEESIEPLDVDLDCESHGGLLEVTFSHGSKIIINKQPPLQQMWVATKFNSHHWNDNRSGSELWQLLTDVASKQAGSPVLLAQQPSGT